MKKIIPFSKYFFPAAVFSTAFILLGVVGYFVRGGFNLGVDFQGGHIQEIQFAPTAFSLTYSGRGNASISFDRNRLDIVITASGIEPVTHSFPFATYRSLSDLSTAFSSIEGLHFSLSASPDTQTIWLIQSAEGNPQLGSVPFVVHFLAPNSPPIAIEDVRSSLAGLGTGTIAVQNLGVPQDRRFMIRIEDREREGRRGAEIINALEGRFGQGAVAITRSDYVDPRFSRQLTDQAGLLMFLTLLLILAYASIRFKPQFATGAVLAIAHDALFTMACIIWIGMEFNTTTIAALLTIVGYSINDTIVVFDRMRENRKLYPDDIFIDVLNRSLSETLKRTIITTVTTLVAVLALFIFTRGSMRDFALALMIGMTVGVYSTIFIATGFVNYWDIQVTKRAKKKLLGGIQTPSKASN